VVPVEGSRFPVGSRLRGVDVTRGRQRENASLFVRTTKRFVYQQVGGFAGMGQCCSASPTLRAGLAQLACLGGRGKEDSGFRGQDSDFSMIVFDQLNPES
jgi:hypothetical protein